MVSEYNRFVSQHIRSMPGATQKDKMRAVAAMWRKRKGKGAGLRTIGRGGRMHGTCTMGCKGKHRKGCGFWDDVWEGVKGAAKIAGPRLIDLALKRIGAGGKKKGRGSYSIMPAREGASGGRVRRGRGWKEDMLNAEPMYQGEWRAIGPAAKARGRAADATAHTQWLASRGRAPLTNSSGGAGVRKGRGKQSALAAALHGLGLRM